MDDFNQEVTNKSKEVNTNPNTKRLLILYSHSGRVPALAQEMAKALERREFRVQLMQAERGTAPISCGKYDAVLVGTPVQGAFGGKIAADIDSAIKRCTRLEGKNSIVFVQPSLFGNIKAIQKAMSLLEHQGSIVKDFVIVGSSKDIINFASKLPEILS